LIVDGDSAIDVLVQQSRAKGIIEGRTENLCDLRFVSKSEEIKIGDQVVTSGLNGIFPKGVIIGEVFNVNRKRKGFFQSIQVKPAVDFSKIEEVLVVLKEESTLN
jgi:rod shape-determining protein MreC